jgi:hypothetical protein
VRELRDGGGRDADGCTTIRAQVQLESNGGIAVAVRGATHGSEGRIVSDAVLAAAWIDSWTRQDIDVALWAAPPRRTAIAEPIEQPPRDVAPAPKATAGTATSRWARVALSASYEQTWSDDDAAWRGANVAACVGVAGFCVGGAIRTAFDPERLSNATGVGRSDLSVLALARYPVALGTMSIAPELGVGVGRLSTRRVESACEGEKAPPPNCDPMTDPMCVPEPATMCDPSQPGGTMPTKVFVGDNFEAINYAPRISLALRVAVPLFEHVWLDGLVGWTYTPFAHGSAFEAEPMADPLTPEAIALPGEPSTGFSIALGLRVGAR